MSRVIVLDAGPLGLITNLKRSAESIACAQWLQSHITSGSRVVVPEIADYEVRRELLRANKIKGIARLVHENSLEGNHEDPNHHYITR